MVDLAPFRGKRCLIVGGRQSAFEWAALLHEEGAARVHVSHRHPSPSFEEADWSWVLPVVDGMVDDPGWFRRLTPEERGEVDRRLWAEGRLKVEPWLEPRLDDDSVEILPNTRMVACRPGADGTLTIELDTGVTRDVDHVIFATGYKVDLRRLPLLARGNLLDRIELDDGHPALDHHFQTSVPGLYITSMPATRAFGPFLAFTVSVRTSARLIGRSLEAEGLGG